MAFPLRGFSKRIDRFRTWRLKLAMARTLRFLRLVTRSAKSVEQVPVELSSYSATPGGKIAIIDNSYHAKTVSSSFFFELLRQQFALKIYWDAQWNGGKGVTKKEIQSGGYDMVILWQVFIYYTPRTLRHFGCRKVVIVPMYDDAHAVPDKLFKRYACFPFLSFSAHFHRRFLNLGIRSEYVRFYPDPISFPPRKSDFSTLRGFFWQRNNDITWEQIRQLVEGTPFSSFHIHLSVDPLWYHEVLPDPEEIKKYHITITRWFDRREQYLEILSESNVFFVPRLYEGIGMPFLEALSMGMVVVSPDHPVMNEYLVNGKTGLLYDPSAPRKLDFSVAETIGENARQSCFAGHLAWKSSGDRLFAWLNS